MGNLLSRLTIVLAALVVLNLQGCATSAQKSSGMRNALATGQFDKALAEVEKEAGSDDVMVNMNLGMLRRLNGDYKGSNAAFEKAKNQIEALYSTSISEQAGAVMVNDETISFEGDRYEQVLVHAYMAMNFIDMGDLDSARVEILQADVKMMEWGETPEEDPFMRYLAGIVFEALGDDDDALVSYRKAVKVYQKTRDRQGFGVPVQVREAYFRMLARNGLRNELSTAKKEFGMTNWQRPDTRGQGELVMILNNGLSPQRHQKAFQTWSTEMSMNIRIAVPDYPQPPRYVPRVKMSVNGQNALLETVENIDGLARASLSDDMPVITARAIARAVVKKKSEKEAGERSGGLAQLAMLVVNTATEIADTRCWNTLPQEIQLARAWLPEGQYPVTFEVIAEGGRVVDRFTRKVTIKAGRKTIIIDHWLAPNTTRGSVLSTANSGGRY